MSIPETVRAMRVAGVPDSQIIDTILGLEEERLAKLRARVAKCRNNKKDGNVTSVTTVTGVTASPSPEKRKVSPSHSPSKEKTNPSLNSKTAHAREFAEEFWPIYPHKIGKADALKAFVKARKKASAQEIVEGVKRYVATKPADRPWCNPATFLNQERWTDEPAAVGNGRGPPPPENDLKAAIRRMNEDLGISDEPADTIDAEFTVN